MLCARSASWIAPSSGSFFQSLWCHGSAMCRMLLTMNTATAETRIGSRSDVYSTMLSSALLRPGGSRDSGRVFARHLGVEGGRVSARHAQRVPVVALGQLAQQDDLAHVPGVVRELPRDGLDDGVGLAADGDGAHEIVRRQGRKGRLERGPALGPARHQGRSRVVLELLELLVAV